MAKTYWEKLRDPRWQRKRLEILNRENFTCEGCGSTSDTLNVHHGYYERGLDPWEYDQATLHCLCEGCHQLEQDRLRDLHFEIAKLQVDELDEVMAVVCAIRGARETAEVVA